MREAIDPSDVPHPGGLCPECEEATVMEIDDGEIHCPSGDCGVTWVEYNSVTWHKRGGGA